MLSYITTLIENLVGLCYTFSICWLCPRLSAAINGFAMSHHCLCRRCVNPLWTDREVLRITYRGNLVNTYLGNVVNTYRGNVVVVRLLSLFVIAGTEIGVGATSKDLWRSVIVINPLRPRGQFGPVSNIFRYYVLCHGCLTTAYV